MQRNLAPGAKPQQARLSNCGTQQVMGHFLIIQSASGTQFAKSAAILSSFRNLISATVRRLICHERAVTIWASELHFFFVLSSTAFYGSFWHSYSNTEEYRGVSAKPEDLCPPIYQVTTPNNYTTTSNWLETEFITVGIHIEESFLWKLKHKLIWNHFISNILLESPCEKLRIHRSPDFL